MTRKSAIEDLFLYNDWAHQRLFQLCEGLTDEQLDEPREMGFGCLRATLFHNLAAEQIWLDRWKGLSWRPLPGDSQRASLAEIADGLQRTAQERAQLIGDERSSAWQRMITFRDSKGREYRDRLADQLLHVANHGIHHRAQGLSFLKRFGRTVPAGLDYLFYRLARPTVLQEPATAEGLRGFGLEVNSAPGVEVDWDRLRIERYFAYHDWANTQILKLAAQLDGAALDRDFGIGPGSIRKTLAHLHDVEPWWISNWTEGPTKIVRSAVDAPLADLQESWETNAQRRNVFIASLSANEAQRIVSIPAGGPPTRIRISESLVQLCCHGTHHRAQLNNMLRHSGVAPPALDYIIWARQAA